MRGNITRRGKSSWRIKFDVGSDPITGERRTRFVTVRGKRQDAEKELTRLLNDKDKGTLVDPTKITVAGFLSDWFDHAHDLAPKTLERYRQIADRQINPHLGAIELQKLKPAQVRNWHGLLLKRGLSPGTARLAHQVLRRALSRAVEDEAVSRNVASGVSAPKVEAEEVAILNVDQINEVLSKLDGHWLHPIATLALGTGMRRGELLALRWEDIDFNNAAITIERSLEETNAGLRFKSPKNKRSRRIISLSASTVAVMRAFRLQQLEIKMAVGHRSDLVFATIDGAPRAPDTLSVDWRRVSAAKGLPSVNFHALRHTHASALINAGLDVVKVSRRLGHASPTITLRVYAHLFDKKSADTQPADAIERLLAPELAPGLSR
jgi:integrase